MYRYRHNDVLKWYFICTEIILQKTRTEIDVICTKVVMYRNCPPLVSKLKCTESDLTHLEQGANDLDMVQLMSLPPHHSLALVKFRMVYLSGAGLPRLS